MFNTRAEQLFRDNPPIVKKPRKVRKRQCKSSAPSPKKSEVSRSSYNKDAVTCQYLMAEAFVKSLLQWKCTLPKEEFKDIADIVIKRLSTILEYTPVDSGDRTTQQMRFLADIIAAWIAGVLFEVAEAHKEDLEKECEERRKIKEEEETEDDTEESEEEEFIPRIIEESHSLKTVEAAELGEESEKEEEKSDGEEGEDENKIPKDGYDDDDEGDDGPGGAGGVSGRTEPPENDAEPPVDDEKPPEEETDVSPSEELPEESEPAPDEAPLDTLESSSKISATDLDQEPPEGDGPSAPLGEELPADENPLTTEDQEDGDEDQSVVPTAVPSSPPLGTSEDIPDKSAASIPAIESAIEKEVGGEESETGALPETLEEAPVLTPEITSEDAGYTPAAAEVPEEALATPATPQATPSEQVTDSRPSDALATPQSTPSEQLMEEKSSSTLVPQSSTVEGIESEVKSLIDQTPATPIEEPGEKPGEVATKDDASVKNLGLDITAEDLSKAGIPSSLPSPGPQTKGQEKKLKDSEFIEGNIRKMMQTDVPFLDLIRIFDRIENAVAKEKENDGEDLLTDRIHRAVYEKLERLAKAESPEKWTPHLQDVLDVLSGKIAQWVRNILTNSEIFFLNENPPMVESAELRNFGKWIGEMSERANSWTVWMQNMIDEWTKMQSNQVTKIDWQNWTRNFAAGALKWRRYYLESVHHAHHNRTMLAGRDVVKTGEMKYPEWSIQEREIENIDLLQE
ncbi:FK506-binding protein 5-like isoform X2 [Diachasmimorpha longicaudata]|uniref:FK506-binding protein 5-like isoform X2 n=1 Tax=Diachasmimorpha longicaudata TaxID=58733 RepID=UPI0030B8739B